MPYPYKEWFNGKFTAEQPYSWSKHVTILDGRSVVTQKPLSVIYTEPGWYEMTVPDKEKEKWKCQRCERAFLKSELIYGPNPFEQEMNGDSTEVYLCETCHETLAGDI